MKRFFLSLGVLALLVGAFSPALFAQADNRPIDVKISEVPGEDRDDFRAEEVMKHEGEIEGEYRNAEKDIVIESIEKIDGGVQVFASASQGGKPLGFGPEGTTEIERFRIINPPTLVEDPEGTLVREWTDDITGITRRRKLREDPDEALREALAQIIRIVGRSDTEVILGSRGNTTSTFYPAAGAVEPVDGNISESGTSWAATHDAASADSASNTAAYLDIISYTETAGSTYHIRRSMALFDTSSITDTDTVDSATLSFYEGGKNNGDNDGDDYINVYAATPASTSSLVADDFDQCGTTGFATAVDIGNITDGVYYDLAFNATGIANISLTGISKFCGREGHDAINDPVTNTSGVYNRSQPTSADTAGTTQDPKLVVVHSAAAATSSPIIIILSSLKGALSPFAHAFQ